MSRVTRFRKNYFLSGVTVASKSVVALPTIGQNDRTWKDHLPNKPNKAISRHIWYLAQSDASKVFVFMNLLDLTGSVTSAMYEASAEILLEDPEVHGIIVLGLHHTPGLLEDFVDRVAKLSKNQAKPVVACDIGETEMAMFIRSRFDKFGIPAYSSPEDAARAMAALSKYGLYLRKNGCFVQYMKSFWDRTKV